METIIITYAIAGAVMSMISAIVMAIYSAMEEKERKKEHAEFLRKQIEVDQKYRENAEARRLLEERT